MIVIMRHVNSSHQPSCGGCPHILRLAGHQPRLPGLRQLGPGPGSDLGVPVIIIIIIIIIIITIITDPCLELREMLRAA